MTREKAIIDLNALKFILDNDQYTDEIEEALDTAISALQQSDHIADGDKKVKRMDDLISKLSEIRSEYNCFDEDEEQQYRALSETIKILSQLRKL